MLVFGASKPCGERVNELPQGHDRRLSAVGAVVPTAQLREYALGTIASKAALAQGLKRPTLLLRSQQRRQFRDGRRRRAFDEMRSRFF